MKLKKLAVFVEWPFRGEKLEGNRTMNMAQRDKTFNSFTVHK